MTYIRTTYDEYEVQGFYYGEWEVETTECIYKDARAQLKLYRENQPEIRHRIKRIRVKKSKDQLLNPDRYCHICWAIKVNKNEPCIFCN